MANENNGPDQSVTDAWNRTMEKFTSVQNAATSALKAATQQTTTARIAEERLVKSLMEELKYTKEKAKQAIKEMQQDEKDLKLQQEIMEAEKARNELEEQISKDRVAGAKKVATSLGDLVKNSLAAANGLYNTESAFSGVTPIVTLMGSTIGGVTEGLAKMVSGIPILGGVAEGTAKLVGVGVSLVTQALNMQLENAQKFADTYNNLSKVGVSFGGDIEAMRNSAAQGGLALDSYSKFVINNLDKLTTFGGSTQTAADAVMKLTKNTLINNDKLLTMYGSYESVNDAAAGYVELMARTGYDVTKNINSLNAGAAGYLFNMKELSNLTGQSADAIKKEQEARMKSSSYQLALSKMSAEEQTAARNKVSMVTAMYGKEAGDLLEEMTAGQGTVISESGLQLQAMLGPIAQSIQEIYKAGTGADSSARTAEVMTQYADTIGEFAKKNQNLMFLNYGVQDQTLTSMNSVLSQTLQTLNRQRDLTAAQVENAKESAKPLTEAGKEMSGVIKGLNEFKMTVDKLTAENFKNMAAITTSLIGVMTEFYGLLKPEQIGFAMKKFIDGLHSAADALGVVSGNKPGPANTGKTLFNPEAPGAGGVVGRAYNAVNAFMNRQAEGAGIGPGGAAKGTGKLQFKNETEATGGGATDPRIIQAAELISSEFAGTVVNAFNDKFHWSDEKYKNSKHRIGMAADLRVPDFKKPGALEKMNQLIADLGVKAEDHGDHVHMEAYKNGGVTKGPSIAGEAGAEAVVPLPDGRTIPVRMDMSEMTSKLEEMISLLKDQRDNSEKLLYATQ